MKSKLIELILEIFGIKKTGIKFQSKKQAMNFPIASTTENFYFEILTD